MLSGPDDLVGVLLVPSQCVEEPVSDGVVAGGVFVVRTKSLPDSHCELLRLGNPVTLPYRWQKTPAHQQSWMPGPSSMPAFLAMRRLAVRAASEYKAQQNGLGMAHLLWPLPLSRISGGGR